MLKTLLKTPSGWLQRLLIVALTVLVALAPLPAVAEGGSNRDPEDGIRRLPLGHALPYGELKRLLSSDEEQTLIVHLQDPPIARQQEARLLRMPFEPQRPPRRIDFESQEVRAYEAFLAGRRAAFRQALEAQQVKADVLHEYSVTLNGLAIRVQGRDITTVLRTPGVKGATLARRVYPLLATSVTQISAPQIWEQVGGAANAGAGMKIAIIDTGIDPTHPFLRDPSLTPPPGYPRGQLQFTSNKVIVARVMSDRTLQWPTAIDDVGHGTHLAGIAAGIANFKTPDGKTISGVAPKAFLMNYKALYEHGSDGFFGTEQSVVAGIEAAVRDGADVINLSLGGIAVTDPTLDSLALAAEGAVAAGVVVAVAAGNQGSSSSTVSSPGSAPSVLTVGAVSAGGLIVVPVRVTGPGTPPKDLISIDGIPFIGPPQPNAPVGPARYVPTELNGQPRPGTSLRGAIALIPRGEFLFAEKIRNAAAAGAIGAVIWNHTAGQEPFAGLAPDTTIPAVLISNEDGQKLVAWYNQNPGSAQLQMGYPGAPRLDVLGDFSSRGPGPDYNIKPDVSAPGLDILSSTLDGQFEKFSGTSMATPHVAGAAALLKQLHPTWTPREIKAALIATAKPVFNLSRTKQYGLMDSGAGRIDVAAAGAVRALVDPPKMSFGRQTLGTRGGLSLSQTFRLRDVSGEGGTYTAQATLNSGHANIAVHVSPDRLTLKPGGEVTFTVRLSSGPGLAPGDYEGQILLTGPSTLRVPIWVRVQAGIPVRAQSVLVVDELGVYNDRPDDNPYTRALKLARYPYTYWDASKSGYPTAADMASASAVMWVQARGQGSYLGTNLFIPAVELRWEAVQRELKTYLEGGGRLFVVSQEIAWWSSTVVGDDDPFLRKYLHVRYLQDDPGGRAIAGVEGDPIGGGLQLKVNQEWPDELGIWATDSLAQPVFRFVGLPPRPNHALSPLPRDVTVGNLAAVRVAGEPRLTPAGVEPSPIPYRVYFQSVTLEGIEDDGERAELVRRIIGWLTSDHRAEVAAPVAGQRGVGTIFHALAQATDPRLELASFLWDFGDGSPLVRTSTPSVRHVYEREGVYTVRVEITDRWGHRSVSPGRPIVIHEPVGTFLPIVTQP